MVSTRFVCRDAGTSDVDVDAVVGAMDSAVIRLAATTDGEMWGRIPFSEREGTRDSVAEDLRTSEKYRQGGEGEARRSFIAELQDQDTDDGLPRRVDDQGKLWLPVGSIDVLVNNSTGYLNEFEHLKQQVDDAKAAGFLLIEFLVSDSRAGDKSKGAGAALIEHVKQFAIRNNFKVIFVDCWDGGTRGLVRYYENLGFKASGEFSRIREKTGGIWHGRLFRMDL